LEKDLALECNEECAGAWLLGWDCTLLAESSTLADLTSLLEDDATRQKLLIDMIRGERASGVLWIGPGIWWVARPLTAFQEAMLIEIEEFRPRHPPCHPHPNVPPFQPQRWPSAPVNSM
jgi:hypothetical protein